MKNILDRISSRRGITLVELLVALLLVFLLMGFVTSANLFVKKFIMNWENNITIYEDGRFILSLLSKDISLCQNFREIDSSRTIIYLLSKDSVVYDAKNGHLFRNNKSLNSPKVVLDSIDLQRISFEKETPDSIFIFNNNKYSEKLVLINVTLSYKNLNESFKTAVRLPNEHFIY